MVKIGRRKYFRSFQINMCEYYHIVPWYNSVEWHNAYNAICSENSNKQDALHLLLLWKARCPSLPSGIESTLSLLQVHIQDYNSDDNVANDQILRLAYSSAIMRFVNHMLDSETARGSSLYQAAKRLGVPDWIIDLRHDTAHSNTLPSLTLLRNACEISLDWLKKSYWNKYKECIQDYTSGQKDAENNENRINAFFYFYSCMSICKNCKIKNITDIPDISMQESIVNDAGDSLGVFIDLADTTPMSVGKLINMLDVQAKTVLKPKDTALFANKALLGEESLLLSLDLVDFLSKNEFINRKLSRRFVHSFELLLTFLHKNDLLVELVIGLIEMTQNCDCDKKSLLAALWVSEILASLKKSKQYLARASRMDSYSISNKKKDLKQMYFHWFPNERATGLILDLQKPVPTKLTDINFLQPIISTYNPYLTYFVHDLLVLVEPKLPTAVSDNICTLAKLISDPDNTLTVQVSQNKIYTIADLKVADGISDVSELKDNNEPLIEMNDEECISGIWRIASKLSWSSCPIGQVPQQNVDVEMA